MTKLRLSPQQLPDELWRISHEADVSVSTVQRRLKDPDIDDAIREGRTSVQRQAVGRLNADLNNAIDRLREFAAHDDPSIALRAIDKLLMHAHRFNRETHLDDHDAPAQKSGV